MFKAKDKKKIHSNVSYREAISNILLLSHLIRPNLVLYNNLTNHCCKESIPNAYNEKDCEKNIKYNM